MKKFFDSSKMLYEARANGKGHVWIIEILIFLLVFLIASVIQAIPTGIGEVYWLLSDPEILRSLFPIRNLTIYLESIEKILSDMPAWIYLVQLFSTALLTLTAILFCRWIEKRRTATMGFRKSGAVREYLFGILAAFIAVSLSTLIGILTGAYILKPSSFSVGLIILYLVGFMIQGMAEEVMCRGYLMVSIARKNPMWLAVLLSALVFSLLHLANPGFNILSFLSIFLMGIFLAVYVLKRGNIWGACAFHSFWNFFLGNFYGISVSGTGYGQNASVFVTTANPNMELWSGGNFGLEAALGSLLVEAAAILIVVFIVPSKKDEIYISENV